MRSGRAVQHQQPCSPRTGWTAGHRDPVAALTASPCCGVGLDPGVAAQSSTEGGPHGRFVYGATLHFSSAYSSSSQLASRWLCCGKWSP